jgi:multidrug efflux pump subunit AcrA (membrane-fusion protein)
MAKITAGQLVEAHDLLWEIVDPDKLWVEVLVYNGDIASNVDRAWAVTSEGESLPVAFIGRGLTLENQGILLQFRVIGPPESLSVGNPVTVFVESDTSASGVILPQSAVVRNSSAQDIVWEHVAAELFVPHPVRVRSINGEQVVVLSGLGPDKRIVFNGAGLLNHVR